ncbi:ATP-dependent RecD-like DNA helicase [uncultured Limosilactobacillus sp.]|uniref:SF1B family DNA helicase RecD2 n=1 Tax=uncultured Limosilactobacillus sp. TaxID=2837629 RepID=UPI0025E1BBB9|nr:ATP-dependent RecD-like DNA helicase [uncultured Limosilactobacillus sp.]
MVEYHQPIQHLEGVTTTGPTSFIGTVKVLIFERGLFRILSVSVEDANFEWDQESITVKGQLGEIVEGDRYEFEGRVVDDQRYGLQFASTGCHVVMPQSSSQLTTYLKYHHVRLKHPRKSSRLIFDALGGQAMNIVLDDPHCLAKLTEMDKSDQDQLIDFFTKLDFGNSTGQIIKKLQQYGFSERQVNLIFDQYGVQTLMKIRNNPYQLAVDLFDNGISFQTIDQIALRFYSVSLNDDRRLQGAILYSLKELIYRQGGSFVIENDLFALTNRNLSYNLDQSDFKHQLSLLKDRERIQIEDHQHVYESSFYNAEWKIAQKLHELILANNDEEIKDQDFKEAIKTIEKEQGYQYDQVQIAAIREALIKPVMLLTGGPGTGKTTIVNGVVEAFLMLHPKLSREDIMLVAPTGRAAKQINLVTGIEASTIHRLLGLNADINDEQLMQMAFDPLDTKLLIVDEMSMTSMALFTALLSAIEPGTHIVLVGDCDQLPSVGPGQVFYDLLANDDLPQRRLKHIYRQSNDSTIIPLANWINDGKVTKELFAPDQGDHYAHRQFIQARLNDIPQLVAQAVKLYHEKHTVPIMDIQILTPIHGGVAGTINLNRVLQAALNPDDNTKPAIQLGQRILRVGDKVMQTVNDPEKNVFNGDLGIIKSIEGSNVIHGSKGAQAKQKVVVDFDGVEVEYLRLNEINALQLAYCMTIHKSQGSQAPVVIIAMADEFFPRRTSAPTIMHRNLLYTAVTRSSQALLMIGSPQAFVRCAESPTQYRQTTLAKRIKMVWQNEHALSSNPDHSKGDNEEHSLTPVQTTVSVLTPKVIEDQLIDPMIGMEGMKPSDF